MRKRAALVALSLLAFAGPGAGQQPLPCPVASACDASQNPAVADIYGRKEAFVAAIRQLAVTLTGTFGDEGRRVRTDLNAIDAALDPWDAAIGLFEKEALTTVHDADAHLALGVIYLDRYRVDDAIREFGAAIEIDAPRVDAHRFMALAQGLAVRPSEAIRALTAASALAPDDPVAYYDIARYLLDTGREREAVNALQAHSAAVQKQLAARPRRGGPVASFQRAGLLRQPAGVAPIFPPVACVPAFELLMKGAFKDAIDQCRRAVDADPALATGAEADSLTVASAALRRGDLPSALRLLRAAVDANPDRSEAHRILGTAFRLDEQIDASIEQYRAAVGARPADERSRMALADTLIAAERFADAEQVLTDAIRTVPGTVQAHYRLGRLYQSLARYPEALRELEQAARFTPLVGQDPLYEMIGAIAVTQLDFSHAADALRKQVAVNPNNADAHRRLADVYVRMDRLEEAHAEFSACLLINAGSVDSYIGIGQIQLRAGRFAQAAEAAQSAIALDPTRTEAHYVLATSLLRAGDSEQGNRALLEFQRLQADAAAATRQKYQLDGLRREATVSIAGSDFVRAEGALRELIVHEPDNVSHHVRLGDVLLRTKRPADAIEHLERAMRLAPSDPDVHRRLAEAYRVAGRTDASRKEADLYRALIEAAKKERVLRLGGF